MPSRIIPFSSAARHPARFSLRVKAPVATKPALEVVLRDPQKED